MKLSLSVAIGNYDRTRALVDGRVQIDGVHPAFMTLSPEEMFFRAFRHADFDITELSLASYAVSLANGANKYVALPIFLSRAFRHSSIYVTRASGIQTPDQMRGKRIGIAEYQLTANVWARALMEDDFGVSPPEITWVRGGMDAPVRPEKLHLDLPSNVKVEAVETGETQLERCHCFYERCFCQDCNVVRLFDDSVTVGLDYYRRTGIFPIMHVLGVRKTLLEQQPFRRNIRDVPSH